MQPTQPTQQPTCQQATRLSIGVFDSGLGGLTVVREIVAQMPEVAITYIADQAHVPYGERPLPEVERFALGLTNHLIRAENASLVVMACNISSSVALSSARALVGADAVLGVIEPGVGHALSVTRNQRVGVLATTGTVKSGAYSETFRRLAPNTEVVEVACPEFVPLIEASRIEDEEAREAAARRLAPLIAANVDTIVLGCTHYPLMLKTLESVLGLTAARIRFVDPARATAAAANGLFPSLPSPHTVPTVPPAPGPQPCETQHAPKHTWMTTGDPAAFRTQLERFAPELLAHGVVRALRWDEIAAPNAPGATQDARTRAERTGS
ncbi:MAG: glutamate racemase [Deltaproteobacteria bacterium]|nr:glutamate racemase [Deltaproteobacteria bacterium]